MVFYYKNNFTGFLITWVGNTIKVLENMQVNMQNVVSRGKKGRVLHFKYISTNFYPARKMLLHSA